MIFSLILPTSWLRSTCFAIALTVANSGQVCADEIGGVLVTAPGTQSAQGVAIFFCPITDAATGTHDCSRGGYVLVDVVDSWGTFKITNVPKDQYVVYAVRDISGDGHYGEGDEMAVHNNYPHTHAEVMPAPTKRIALRLRPYDGTQASILHGHRRDGWTPTGPITTIPSSLIGNWADQGSARDTVNPITGAYASTDFSSRVLSLRPDGTFEKTAVFNSSNICAIYETSGTYELTAIDIKFSESRQRKKNCFTPGWRPLANGRAEVNAWRLRYSEGYGVGLELANGASAAMSSDANWSNRYWAQPE